MSTLAELADQIRALKPSAQLRLAADLIDAHKPDLALVVVAMVHGDLQILETAGALAPDAPDVLERFRAEQLAKKAGG